MQVFTKIITCVNKLDLGKDQRFLKYSAVSAGNSFLKELQNHVVFPNTQQLLQIHANPRALFYSCVLYSIYQLDTPWIKFAKLLIKPTGQYKELLKSHCKHLTKLFFSRRYLLQFLSTQTHTLYCIMHICLHCGYHIFFFQFCCEMSCFAKQSWHAAQCVMWMPL